MCMAAVRFNWHKNLTGGVEARMIVDRDSNIVPFCYILQTSSKFPILQNDTKKWFH